MLETEGLSLTERPSRSPHAPAIDGPDVHSLRKLADLLSAHAPHDGRFELRLPGVYAARRSRQNRAPVHVAYPPVLCVVAQGAKIVMLGREVYEYDASHMLAVSVDLPVASQVVRASEAKPFLAFILALDPLEVAELTLKVYPQGVPRTRSSRGLYVCQATTGIVEAATRLLELMAQPGEAELLGPLVVEEILIRLLRSSIGSRVAQIGQAEAGVPGVAKAVSWLRANFSQPMTVERLADLAHMSVSSFHQHFKAVTSMSPLQYQKLLRLQEARSLMLSRTMDAGTAGRHVGYLSPSQFSREYARLFGGAPTRDIARLREQGFDAVSR